MINSLFKKARKLIKGVSICSSDDKLNSFQFFEPSSSNIFTGKTRTGKTYGVVYWSHMYGNNSTIYSNIDGHKDNVIQYDMNELVSQSEILHNYFKILDADSSVSDTTTPLKEKQKEIGFFLKEEESNGDTILIIDEAFNAFNKRIDSILWLITYASRFDLRLIFIVQDISLIHRDYSTLINNIIDTVDLNKRKSSNFFFYRQYDNKRNVGKAEKALAINKLPICNEVFSYYKTPDYSDNNINVNIKWRRIMMITVISAILLGLYGFFSFGLVPEDSSPVLVAAELNTTIDEPGDSSDFLNRDDPILRLSRAYSLTPLCNSYFFYKGENGMVSSFSRCSFKIAVLPDSYLDSYDGIRRADISYKSVSKKLKVGDVVNSYIVRGLNPHSVDYCKYNGISPFGSVDPSLCFTKNNIPINEKTDSGSFLGGILGKK